MADNIYNYSKFVYAHPNEYIYVACICCEVLRQYGFKELGNTAEDFPQGCFELYKDKPFYNYAYPNFSIYEVFEQLKIERFDSCSNEELKNLEKMMNADDQDTVDTGCIVFSKLHPSDMRKVKVTRGRLLYLLLDCKVAKRPETRNIVYFSLFYKKHLNETTN